MPYDYGGMGRLPMDPRMLTVIERSPVMTAEQGPAFLQGWGGPSGYQLLSGLPMDQRLTYAAIEDGAVTPEEIEAMTGLSLAKVKSGIEGLGDRGFIPPDMLGSLLSWFEGWEWPW